MTDCAVCDRPDADTIVHGYPVHRKCAPTSVLKDAAVHDVFMRRVRQLGKTRYERWAKWKP